MKHLAFILAALTTSAAFADAPCKDKREAKHASHKTLHACLESWAKDGKVGEADPTDDCAGSLSTFVQSAKDLKACRTEHQNEKKK